MSDFLLQFAKRVFDVGLVLILAATIVSLLSFNIVSTPFNVLENMKPYENAFADGLASESFPPVLVAGRQISMAIDISPVVLTTENVNMTKNIRLRLFDENTDESIKHVSYLVEIQKDGEVLIRYLFHSHAGILNLEIEPSEAPITVYGSTDPVTSAWLGSEQEGPAGTESLIKLKAPLLIEGGLYYFQVRIVGIDNDSVGFDSETAPSYETWLSVGDVVENRISLGDQTDDTMSIISYYDKVSDVSFNANEKSITWSMPFDWSIGRIGSHQILVHQELNLPSSYVERMGLGNFKALINGMELPKSLTYLDPYTQQNRTIFHIILNKSQLLNLAKSVDNRTSDTMDFILRPDLNNSISTSSYILADYGGLGVFISWNPSGLTYNQSTSANLRFVDSANGDASLDYDVLYDFEILDMQNKIVERRTDLIAVKGVDSQEIVFPSNDLYRTVVKVKSQIYSDIQDDSRNGMAVGYVIVPEFPPSAYFAIVALFIFTIVVPLRIRFLARAVAA
jgi:hypothetical protein